MPICKPFIRLRPGWVGVAVLAGALPLVAHADIDWSSADWGGYSVDSLSYWSYSDMSRRSAEQAHRSDSSRRSEKPAKPARKPAALSTASNVSASGAFVSERGIEQLAGMYPREQFAERKQQYRQIVQGFNQNVQKLYGVPPNNLATGMAVALAGSYSAYHNRPFPDEWVKPLYRQMEKVLLDNPRLTEESASKKATDYQVMVGTGMAMLLTQAELQKAPNAATQAQLRRTAAEVLRAVIHADPQQVDFSSSGVRIR